MSKSFCSLGLMSGTSADGVDASIIQSNGDNEYKVIIDRYFEYKQSIYENIHNLKEKIKDSTDLKRLSREIQVLEEEITVFHSNVVNEIVKKCKINIDFVGFHGQTIFHNAREKISKQLGDGKLLSKLTKKTTIYEFRKNDLIKGGQGAPLTPIFHKLLKKKFKIDDVIFINIGGITNITSFCNKDKMSGSDIGPGMCLIDRWVRQKSNNNFDKNGIIAKSGEVHKAVLEKLIKNFYNKDKILEKGPIKSYDTEFFDFSFIKNLPFNDGVTTLTEFTAQVIISFLKLKENNRKRIILCGGGRKNNYLVEKLREKKSSIKLIDDYGVDGDFVESQAFAYLAIRSFLNLPISFPETTGVKEPSVGGIIVKN